MGTIPDEETKQLNINKMKESYRILREKGFNIHGWVTPSSSLHSSLYEPLSNIFDYGFGTGQSTSVYHKFGEEKHIHHMSRVGIETNVIRKTATSGVKPATVVSYIAQLWGNATADEDYETVSIIESPFDNLIANAIMDGYDGVEIVEGTLNETAMNYLEDIWEVSTAESTLVVNTDTQTVSLTPKFKLCCEREGMRNIRNYIDTAIAQNAFLSFYAHNSYAEDNALNSYSINLSKYTRQILAYCKKQGVKVLNAADGVRDYFSFRYDDFLALKNS